MTLEELGIINDMPRGWVSGKSAPKWHYKFIECGQICGEELKMIQMNPTRLGIIV